MTEKEKMLGGEMYDPTDKELADRRALAHRLCFEYNNTPETDTKKREEILTRLMPSHGKGTFLQSPIQIDYGIFTAVGENFYANFNFVVLDTCPINIGDNVYFGPNCTLATPLHPLNHLDRRYRTKADGSSYDLEYGKPITIGSDCWIASNVVICAGVTIGDNCVIGAGSVVTRDIPDNSLAAGNPCRVIREVE
ncbi:MAG: sugar O-acetyltransferase [Firmicutes bacterium]|nr:sugar O-acetyltransferase [[Eubacterium] siraeum]MCM1488268.1 sugar O-acetyltransferase [Bacillota bacterium]